MNYHKSLSELLFEETSEEQKNEKVPKGTVARIKSVSEVPFFLVPPEKLQDFIAAIRMGTSGFNRLKQFFSAENKLKSQDADSLQDVKDDDSAKNIDGLERGSKTVDISYNYIENKLDIELAEKLTAVFENNKDANPLALMNKMQMPLVSIAGKKYKFNFINKTGEDSNKSTGADLEMFLKSGFAFFTLVVTDPTNPKEVVYYTNNDNILVFAFPIKKNLNKLEFKALEVLFKIKENKSFYQGSLSKLLFESDGTVDIEGEEDVDLGGDVEPVKRRRTSSAEDKPKGEEADTAEEEATEEPAAESPEDPDSEDQRKKVVNGLIKNKSGTFDNINPFNTRQIIIAMFIEEAVKENGNKVKFVVTDKSNDDENYTVSFDELFGYKINDNSADNKAINVVVHYMKIEEFSTTSVSYEILKEAAQSDGSDTESVEPPAEEAKETEESSAEEGAPEETSIKQQFNNVKKEIEDFLGNLKKENIKETTEDDIESLYTEMTQYHKSKNISGSLSIAYIIDKLKIKTKADTNTYYFNHAAEYIQEFYKQIEEKNFYEYYLTFFKKCLEALKESEYLTAGDSEEESSASESELEEANSIEELAKRLAEEDEGYFDSQSQSIITNFDDKKTLIIEFLKKVIIDKKENIELTVGTSFNLPQSSAINKKFIIKHKHDEEDNQDKLILYIENKNSIIYDRGALISFKEDFFKDIGVEDLTVSVSFKKITGEEAEQKTRAQSASGESGESGEEGEEERAEREEAETTEEAPESDVEEEAADDDIIRRIVEKHELEEGEIENIKPGLIYNLYDKDFTKEYIYFYIDKYLIKITSNLKIVSDSDSLIKYDFSDQKSIIDIVKDNKAASHKFHSIASIDENVEKTLKNLRIVIHHAINRMCVDQNKTIYSYTNDGKGHLIHKTLYAELGSQGKINKTNIYIASNINIDLIANSFFDNYESLKVFDSIEDAGYKIVDEQSLDKYKESNISNLDQLFSLKTKQSTIEDVHIRLVDKEEKVYVNIEGILNITPVGKEKKTKFIVDEIKSYNISKSLEKISKNESFIYRNSLSSFLFESDGDDDNPLASIGIEKESSYSKDDLEAILNKPTSNYKLFNINIGRNSKANFKTVKTKNEKNAEKYKKKINKILSTFENKGLEIADSDKKSLMYLYDDIKLYGVSKVREANKDKEDRLFSQITLGGKTLNDSVVTSFISSAFKWLLENKFSDVSALQSAFEKDGINENDFMKFLSDYFNLNLVSVERVFESKNLNNNNLLNENKKINSFLNKATKTFNNLLSSVTPKFAKIWLKNRNLKKRILTSISSNDQVKKSVGGIIADMVTYFIYEFHRINFGINYKFDESGKSSKDLNLSGDFVKDINLLITGEIQKSLFTESFRKTQQEANPGKKITDDDLLKVWEANLNDMVMSYMGVTLTNESEEVREEKENIAYSSRMKEMDSNALAGIASFPASMAIATALAPTTGGLSLLGIGLMSAFFGGTIAGGITKKLSSKPGPKEKAYLSNSEKDKMIIRNIIIQLAKEELEIKESANLSDDLIYIMGLSLLTEGLLSEEDDAESQEESDKDEKDPDIRGSISWNKISRKLTSSNFFLFNPKVTNPLGRQKASERQYEFGCHLAALTEECFGLIIKDVEKMDIREAQSLSVSRMLVKQDAAMGEGAMQGGAQNRGMNGKGLDDNITTDEFLHLVNNFPGGMAQAVVYLLVNGRLDGLLKTIKGGDQTPMDIIGSLSDALSGNISNMPSSMSKSVEEAIQNLNSDSWVKKLVKAINKDAPIIVVYNEDVIDKDQLVEFVNETLVNDIVSFSKGFKSDNNSKLINNLNNNKFNEYFAVISKSKSFKVEGKESSHFRFSCEEQNARRLIAKDVCFVEKSRDENLKDKDFDIKIFVSGEQDTFNEFEKQLDTGKWSEKDEVETLSLRITAILVIKAMRRGGFYEKYQKEYVDLGQLRNKSFSGKDYAIRIAKIILKKEVSITDYAADDDDAARKAKARKNISAITIALQEQYKNHLDLCKLWKSR